MLYPTSSYGVFKMNWFNVLKTIIFIAGLGSALFILGFMLVIWLKSRD